MRIRNPFEGFGKTAIGQKIAPVLSKTQRSFKAWMLRRRRARAVGKKSANRKTVYSLTASLIILLLLFAWALSYLEARTQGMQLRLDQYSDLADEGRIVSALFLDEDAVIVGTILSRAEAEEIKAEKEAANAARTAAEEPEPDPKGKGKDKGAGDNGGGGAPADEGTPPAAEKQLESDAPSAGGLYWVAYPESDALIPVLNEMVIKAGADVEVDRQTTKSAVRTVTTFLLPLMILANLFAVLFSASKSSGSGIGEVMMFGSIAKGRSTQRKKGPKSVTFGDVAGADEAVAELREVVDYLQDPQRYEEIGAMPPKGVLLFGPPGCGKTLLAKAVAGEAGVPFFSVAGAEFVESLVGVGAARVRDLFARVRAVAPAIVFIDELDAAGRKRGTGGGGGGSDEREQTLNQILVEMDGFEVESGIVIIGATNRPDILDPALLRPGRFDRHVTVDQPDLNGREEILELHARGKPMAPTVDFNYLARRTPGFSGADLANVLNEAALLTVRESKAEIETVELEEAVQRVLAGPKKRGRVLSPEERKRAAFHESGHAIVAAAAGRLEEVHRVSILSRGRGIGMASIQRESDAALFTRSQLIAQLVTAMAGIACEQLVFGEPSTGAEQDLEQATDLARDMIGRFGMGKRRRRLLAKESESFLGDELLLGQISGETHTQMESEIDHLLEEAEQEATRLLQQHHEVLDTLATRLELEETLEGPDLEAVLSLVRPEVTFFGGLGEGPLAHAEAGLKDPLGTP
jgi:cell division protease FtsH